MNAKRLSKPFQPPPQTNEVNTTPDLKRDPDYLPPPTGRKQNPGVSEATLSSVNAGEPHWLKPFYPDYTPVVDPEFASLFCNVEDDNNSDLLEELIHESRYACPIIISQQSKRVLDHHQVFKICLKHKIPYLVVELDLPDQESELKWVIRNQCLRRNLSSFAKGKLVLDILSNTEDMKGGA